MLINAVTYAFPANRADEVAGLLARLASLSRLEPGCHGFEAARSNDDPSVFILYEHFIELGINGIRPLAQSRLAHKCTPLIG